MRACITLHDTEGRPVYVNPKSVNIIQESVNDCCYIIFNSGDGIVFKETAEEARDIIFPDIQLSDIFNMSEPTLSLL